jgi:hypothetical protein
VKLIRSGTERAQNPLRLIQLAFPDLHNVVFPQRKKKEPKKKEKACGNCRQPWKSQSVAYGIFFLDDFHRWLAKASAKNAPAFAQFHTGPTTA